MSEKVKEFYRSFNRVFVSVSLLFIWGIIGLTEDYYSGVLLVGLSLMITLLINICTRMDYHLSNRRNNKGNK